MTSKEESALRDVYRSWSSDRLARAATQEQREYQPEAIALMSQELQARGISADAASTIVASAPPPIVHTKPERDTWFLPARLNRLQYIGRWLLWAVVLFGGGELIVAIDRDAFSPFVVWIALALVYRVAGIDMPRLKSAGLNTWLLLLLLVPLVNIIMQGILFFAPPKK